MGIMVFSLTLIAPIITLFISFGFYECTFPDSCVTKDNGPCNSPWGSTTCDTTGGETSWGMYYGWYFIVIACIGSLAMFIVGLVAPNPVEEEEYTPITNYGH